AMHDAWSYFDEQYGFELVHTYERGEGQQPSPGDIQMLQEVIEDHAISVFYAEPQQEASSVTRFLQEDLGLEIGVLDPVGGLMGRDSYLELMRYNVHTLARGK
ncbi:MAG: metal ABC transporter solute-binding protein, Zn/Mn family, partial [Acidobacteriota bacterium]